MKKKQVGVILCMLLITTAGLPVMANLQMSQFDDVGTIPDEIPLPPPLPVDMVLEESICRRMSVRYFTSELITDEELSTILWAAYGITENGDRSIFSPNGKYSAVIYVIRSEATYKYVPENHSLSLYTTGNYLYVGSYTAPIKFGLVWDMNIETEEMKGMAQIGMLAENIYFDANALDLGTVTTGMGVEDLYDLGLPSNEKPEIIMPLGHPSSPYDFTYNPLPPSNLPGIMNNTYSLADATNNRSIVNTWDNTSLSLLEQSQVIWSSYGYSYFWDNVNNERHRTLPSAIGIYPFKVFAANQTGVYQYIPNTHSINLIVQGDKRQEIQNALAPSNISVIQAPWITVPCLDTNLGSSMYQRFWYYEVGAIAHNVLLEATALNLNANVIMDIASQDDLRAALGISAQINLLPWAVIPVGHSLSNNPPETPNIAGPMNGKVGIAYNYTINTLDPDGDDVSYWVEWGDGTHTGWIGPYLSGQHVVVNHTWAERGSYLIKVKAKDINQEESDFSTPLQMNVTGSQLEITIRPRGFGVAATIVNIGEDTATQVIWKITLDGGIVLIGRSKKSTIDGILPGGTVTISSFTFGFFKSSITATAGDSSDSLEVFLFGPFVI
jgi:nitroreductase